MENRKTYKEVMAERKLIREIEKRITYRLQATVDGNHSLVDGIEMDLLNNFNVRLKDTEDCDALITDWEFIS